MKSDCISYPGVIVLCAFLGTALTQGEKYNELGENVIENGDFTDPVIPSASIWLDQLASISGWTCRAYC